MRTSRTRQIAPVKNFPSQIIFRGGKHFRPITGGLKQTSQTPTNRLVVIHHTDKLLRRAHGDNIYAGFQPTGKRKKAGSVCKIFTAQLSSHALLRLNARSSNPFPFRWTKSLAKSRISEERENSSEIIPAFLLSLNLPSLSLFQGAHLAAAGDAPAAGFFFAAASAKVAST